MEIKLIPCRVCFKEKIETEFYKRHKNKETGRQTICKDCQNTSLKTHRQHIRNLINRWKCIKGCSECGFKGHHFQLDLDHVNPSTKYAKHHRSYEPNWKKERIKEELSKCVILCANCHRLKTFMNNEHIKVCDSPAHDKKCI